jgi:hypothetical protein
VTITDTAPTESAAAEVHAPRVSSSRKRAVILGLLAVIIPIDVALALRVPALDWGLPDLTYKDEVNVLNGTAQMVSTGSSLPRWEDGRPFYEYPHLTFNLFRIPAKDVRSDLLAKNLAYRDEPLDSWRFALTARRITLAFGIVALVLVVLTGKFGSSLAEGAIAAGLMATSVDHFRYSLWAKPDMIAAGIAAASFLISIVAAQRRWALLAVFAAFVGGLGTAAKYNAGILVVAAGIAALLAGRTIPRRVAALFGAGVAAVGGFFAGMPLGLTRWSEFWSEFTKRYLGAEQLSGFSPPGPLGGPVGAVRLLLRSVRNTFVDVGNAGWILVILFLIGMFRLARRRSRADIVVMAVALLMVASTFRWLRYGFHHQLLPGMGALALVVAGGARELFDLAVAHRRTIRRGGVVLAAAVLALAIAAPAANAVSTNRRYTRALVDTSFRDQGAWVVAHIPMGARVASEGHIGPIPRVFPIYQAYTLSINPVEWYRQEGYGYLLVSTWIRSYHQFDPKARAFYKDLDRAATVLARVPSRQVFGYGGTMVVYRLPKVVEPGRRVATDQLFNGNFEGGRAGWDFRGLAPDHRHAVPADLAGLRIARGPSGKAAWITVGDGSRGQLTQTILARKPTLHARMRGGGNGSVYLQVRALTVTGTHVATTRFGLLGDCLCRPPERPLSNAWQPMTFDLSPLLQSGGLKAVLLELRLVVDACEGCSADLAVDDVIVDG